ncbi:MAG: hypothetical protein ACYTDU_13100 [Planctomycetota bacterium]|jgi:hypothetical protein
MEGRALAALLLLGALAAAQETKRYGTEDGAYTIDLPATWEVETQAGKKAVLLARIRVPGLERRIYLDIYGLTPVNLAPRMQARYEAPAQVEVWKATSHEIGFDPLPWLRLDYKDEETALDEVAVYTFRRRLCRGIHVLLKCEPTVYPKVKDAFFAAALSARCTLPRWPNVPEGYDRREQDGFVFFTAPGVRAHDRKRIRKIVLDTQKDFVKLHGPIVRPPEEPPFVILHAYRQQARPYSKEAAKASQGQYSDHFARRIFAVPVPELRTAAHARLASETHDLLFVESHGDPDPCWARRGEGKLFGMRAQTGRKPPTVTRAWFSGFAGLSHPLDRLDALYDSEFDSYVDHGTGYVLYFRHGPSKYRKAFEAFLTAYRASGDLQAARNVYLDPLDLTELQEKAGRYLARKLKPVESR